MKILILGSSGYLGSRLFKLLQPSYDVFGTYNRSKNDSCNTFHWLGDPESLLEHINQLQPELIINCVGLADVDLCDVLPERAFQLNAMLPYNISKICAELEIKFVHISTDHFEGNEFLPSSEEAQISCPNLYSASKMLGELYVQLANAKSIIVRTNFFHFSLNSFGNFLDNCLNDPITFQNISGFDDIYFTPISTTLLTSSIIKLVDLNFTGVINLSSNEKISKYMFLTEIFTILQSKDRIIHPISHFDSNLLANRPTNMALSNAKFLALTKSSIPSISEMIRMELEFAAFI
jgi:dTDP-4-dehydrorhamnose reductase